jgi:hypothetical protein
VANLPLFVISRAAYPTEPITHERRN